MSNLKVCSTVASNSVTEEQAYQLLDAAINNLIDFHNTPIVDGISLVHQSSRQLIMLRDLLASNKVGCWGNDELFLTN